MEANTDIRIGTCAWSFEDWRGVFYPENLPPGQRLGFYSRFFRSVEIDSTFYAAPSEQTARNWMEATPDDFRFSCKMPREITHVRRLHHCEAQVEQFLTAIEPLRRKLSCVLIQLPPYCTLRRDEKALREFVLRLPPDIRFAIEFREAGWHVPRIAHLLEEHQVCWAWNDITPIERHKEGAFNFLPRTTDFLYVRLLGDLSAKPSGEGGRPFRYRRLLWPRDASLESWAVKVEQEAEEATRAMIYVNNQFEGFSPGTCQRFAEQLGLHIELPSERERIVRKPAGAQLELAF